ncbi:DUF6194 family protein [Nocardia sp. R16R-3T]
MNVDEIIAFIESLGGVLTLRPGPGDGSPEIAWGDTFFYYAPDGKVPTKSQPFATIVTKDYPGDDRSRLDRPGAFRLNIGVDRESFVRWTGHEPRDTGDQTEDPSAVDTVFAHPVYGSAAWLAVVNPGPETEQSILELLRTAHDRVRARGRWRAESQ